MKWSIELNLVFENTNKFLLRSEKKTKGNTNHFNNEKESIPINVAEIK